MSYKPEMTLEHANGINTRSLPYFIQEHILYVKRKKLKSRVGNDSILDLKKEALKRKLEIMA